MNDSRKNLLKMIYNHSREKGTPLQIRADGSDTNSSANILFGDVNYLTSNGYTSEPVHISRYYVLKLTEKGERFVENGFRAPSEIQTNNIFNIENATNSVIGTQSNVTLNINSEIQETRKQIDSSNSDDKAELYQIINLLEMLITEQVPAKKGLFSNFSSVIQRNSWITSPIMSIFLKWLITL